MKNLPDEEFNEQLIAREKMAFPEIDLASLLDRSNLDGSTFISETTRTPEGEKYVVFHLDDLLYGVRSNRVSEVIGSIPVTPLPNVPDWLMGIANLRGDIISVVDLRKLFNKSTVCPGKPRLVVFRSKKNETSIAFVVDKLSEIITLDPKDINFSAADFQDSFPTLFGKVDFKSRPLSLLDIDKILSALTLGRIPVRAN